MLVQAKHDQAQESLVLTCNLYPSKSLEYRLHSLPDFLSKGQKKKVLALKRNQQATLRISFEASCLLQEAFEA